MKKFDLIINNKHYIVEIENIGYENAEVIVNGTEFQVAINRELRQDEDTIPKIVSHIEENKERVPKANITAPKGKTAGLSGVRAPMPGLVLHVLVKPGDKVTNGQTVIKMEAMKMENEIKSSIDGKVKEVLVKPQDNVAEGDILISFESE